MLRRLLVRLGLTTAGKPSVGARGEDAAAAFLKRLGYVILDRNVRIGGSGASGGEADIVARDGETVVLIEVKTRLVEEGKRQPKAEDQVGAHKRRKLLFVMAHLVRANGWEKTKKRIDVVAVEFDRADAGRDPVIRHFINAVKP